MNKQINMLKRNGMNIVTPVGKSGLTVSCHVDDAWIKPFEVNLAPAETIIVPAEGYRIWYAEPSLLLKSITSNILWNPCERLEAKCAWGTCVCKSPEWRTPNYNLLLYGSPQRDMCNAGIYGMKTYEQGVESYNLETKVHKKMNEPENRIVFGLVYLWGKVLECERGFRAQYGYPSGIFNTSDISADLAAIYRVPLLGFKS